MEEYRQEIASAAGKLFLQYGIKSVSMDDVARKISISKKTLYKYFKDKKDLVSTVLECPAHPGFKGMPEAVDMNAVERHILISKIIVEFLASINPSFEYDLEKYYPKLHKKMIKERREEIYKHMSTELNKGIEEGFFRDDMDVELITLLNIVRIETLKSNDIFEVYNRTLVEVTTEYFSYHFHAIATPKGINEYKRIIKGENNV